MGICTEPSGERSSLLYSVWDLSEGDLNAGHDSEVGAAICPYSHVLQLVLTADCHQEYLVIISPCGLLA